MRKSLGWLCGVIAGVAAVAVIQRTEARRAERPRAPVAKATPPATREAPPAPPPPKTPVADGDDVTAAVKHANGSAFRKPPATFRSGKVTVRKLEPKMVTARADGFSVAFPSHAPIVTPTVYKDMVLSSAGFHSRQFYAFDAKTGAPRWGIDLDDDGPSVAACEDDLCAFNTESCTLFVVDAQTGKMKWSLYLGDPLTSSPTIVQGKVYASYPASGHPQATHVLAAFDLKTGKILWQRWLDADVMSAPVAIGTEVYAATFAGTLYTFDATTGDIRSARKVRATSAPTIAGNEVLYSKRSDGRGEAASESIELENKSSGGRVSLHRKAAPYLDNAVQARSTLKSAGMALDASNGFAAGAPVAANAEAARGLVGKDNVSTMQAHQGSRVLRLGSQNVSAQGDELVATDKDGKLSWTTKLDGNLRKNGGALAAPPAAAGGRLVLATLDGHVRQIDGKTGAMQKEYEAKGTLRTQPAVMNGWIYVGTDDGHLVAIDTHDPSLTGWSTWGGDAQRSNVR